MVGIVIVSHSHRIAEGVAELAREMGGPDVRLETAGGLNMPDHPIGTDAVMVMEAIERAWSDDGVLVLMDLGSAVLSAEMALDLMPEERRSRRPALRGADRGGSGGRSRHGETGRAARARRAGSPRRTRREDRAPRGHRNRVVAGTVVGCGRRVIDHADREQPARVARAAGRQVRADRVVVRRPGHGARRDERPRTGRRLQLERRRDARCDAGSHDRGRRVGASGIGGAGGDRGARRARLRRSSRALRAGACRSGVRPPGRARGRPRVSRVRRDRDRARPTVPNARSRDPRRSRRRRGRAGRTGRRARCGRRRHRAPARARCGAGGGRRGGDLRRPSALPAGRRAPVPDQACDRRRWRVGRAGLARRDRAHGGGLGRPRG